MCVCVCVCVSEREKIKMMCKYVNSILCVYESERGCVCVKVHKSACMCVCVCVCVCVGYSNNTSQFNSKRLYWNRKQTSTSLKEV